MPSEIRATGARFMAEKLLKWRIALIKRVGHRMGTEGVGQ